MPVEFEVRRGETYAQWWRRVNEEGPQTPAPQAPPWLIEVMDHA